MREFLSDIEISSVCFLSFASKISQEENRENPRSEYVGTYRLKGTRMSDMFSASN